MHNLRYMHQVFSVKTKKQRALTSLFQGVTQEMNIRRLGTRDACFNILVNLWFKVLPVVFFSLGSVHREKLREERLRKNSFGRINSPLHPPLQKRERFL